MSFRIRAEKADIPYDIDIYTGVDDTRETYLDSASTPEDSVNGWADVQLAWGDFHRAEWEADPGTVFNKSDQIQEIAFGFSGLDSANNAGTIWVDDVQLLGEQSAPVESQPVEETEAPQEQGNPTPRIPCPPAAAALPLLLMVLIRRKK